MRLVADLALEPRTAERGGDVTRGKWYRTGFEEGASGHPSDPPWTPGHRDHTAYCEGYTDGERQRERADAEEGEGEA